MSLTPVCVERVGKLEREQRNFCCLTIGIQFLDEQLEKRYQAGGIESKRSKFALASFLTPPRGP